MSENLLGLTGCVFNDFKGGRRGAPFNGLDHVPLFVLAPFTGRLTYAGGRGSKLSKPPGGVKEFCCLAPAKASYLNLGLIGEAPAPPSGIALFDPLGEKL